MRLFVDTNSLLAYFKEGGDVRSLEEVERLLKEKKIIFFLPVQVESEYIRNVGGRMAQAREAIKKSPNPLVYEPVVGDEALKKSVQSKVEEINAEIESFKAERIKNYSAQAQKTNTLIERIFSLGQRVEYSNQLIEKAKLRHLKGDPPKKEKDDSHGDAINWESILENAIDDDLVIITVDPDYTEKEEGGPVLNRFLVKEWSLMTKKKLQHFASLGKFVNSFEKRDVIPKNTIKEESTAFILDPSYRGALVTEGLTVRFITDAQASVITSLSNMPNLTFLNTAVDSAQTVLNLNRENILGATQILNTTANTVFGILSASPVTSITADNIVTLNPPASNSILIGISKKPEAPEDKKGQ